MTNGLPPALASRQRRSIIDDAVTGLGLSRGAHVSIAGNRFTLVNDAGASFPVPTVHLDVIVVDANAKTSKLFYGGPYDPTSSAPPECFSDNGTGPSVNAMNPQAPTCAVCPNNVIGSDVSKVSGKGIKACSDRKKLAVIIPDDPAVNVYELQIPPASLTNLRNYSKWIGQQASGIENRRLDIADLVTRIEFEAGKMGTLKFTPTAFADDARTLQLIEYIDNNHLSDAAVGRNDVAHDPENVKRLQVGGAMQQIAAPAPTQGTAQTFVMPPRAVPQQIASAPGFASPGQVMPPLNAPHAAAEPQQPAPATPPVAPGRRRGRPAAAPSQPAPDKVAPFMTGAAPPPPPAHPTQAEPQDGLQLPGFLQRQPDNTPKFGMATPPPPPADLAQALGSAMSLPTRR